LKKMLADLGMRGKLSLEKAKQIRAQRELAEEIAAAEEFNRKINRTGARRGAVVDAKKTRAELDTTSEEESSEEESDDEVKVKARGKVSVCSCFPSVHMCSWRHPERCAEYQRVLGRAGL
jgi:hypothetical protein